MYWNASDVYLSILGGLILGLATSLNYLMKGRITGISGVLYSIATFDKSCLYWKLSLLASLSLGSCIMYKLYGENPILKSASPAFDPVEYLNGIGSLWACIGGLLVGIGAKVGNGCTIGHGICGLPRGSSRSTLAISLFIVFGVGAATLKNYLFPLNAGKIEYDYNVVSTVFLCLSIFFIVVAAVGQYYVDKQMMNDVMICIGIGIIFGIGLVVSGLVKPSRINGFLTISDDWDPSLLFVFISAVAMNALLFRMSSKPCMSAAFEQPTYSTIDKQLILGASVFGLGWGCCGLCPAAGLALFPQFTWTIGLAFLGSVSFGMRIGCKIVQMMDTKPPQVVMVDELRYG